jgi:Domain of unknown function (DUF6969)
MWKAWRKSATARVILDGHGVGGAVAQAPPPAGDARIRFSLGRPMELLRSLRSLLRGAPTAPPGPPVPGGPPVPSGQPVALADLPTERLLQSRAAGLALREAVRGLAAEGRTVLDAVLNGNAFAKWRMYPWQGGILDQRSNSQFFYHSHDDYTGEHGHFHTFIYHQRKLVHLVALGMDAQGRINRLYTFNRWGPGDHYFPAAKLRGFLPTFHIGPGNELDARLHAFLTHALVLFRAEIEHLFEARDFTFARYRAEHHGASPFEDRALEITSAVPADVDGQLARIAAELSRRGGSAAAEAPPAAMPAAPAAHPAAGPPATSAAATGAPAAHGAERATEQLRLSHAAALAAQAIAGRLREQGRTVVGLAMNGKAYEPWTMYPWDGGVLDTRTRSQWFYHSHPEAPEHGHFHLFYHHRGQLTHLVAVAMDNRGEPVGLFTTNRWVTDEIYLPAHKLRPLIAQFRIENDAFEREVSDYLRQLLLAFEPEIGALMAERDRVFTAYRTEHRGRSAFEDRDLEVVSTLPIHLDAHTERLAAALRAHGAL